MTGKNINEKHPDKTIKVNSMGVAEFPGKCQKIVKIGGAWDTHSTAF